MYHYTNRTKQVISVAIAVILSIATLKLDKVEANPITAPECRDVPSCVVTGTVVIGGVVYYLIKNTVTGVVRRVPTRQVPPAHRNIGNDPYPVGTEIPIPGIVTKAKCEERAKRIQRDFGGEWITILEPQVGGDQNSGNTGGAERIGSPEFTPLFRCRIKRVR